MKELIDWIKEYWWIIVIIGGACVFSGVTHNQIVEAYNLSRANVTRLNEHDIQYAEIQVKLDNIEAVVMRIEGKLDK